MRLRRPPLSSLPHFRNSCHVDDCSLHGRMSRRRHSTNHHPILPHRLPSITIQRLPFRCGSDDPHSHRRSTFSLCCRRHTNPITRNSNPPRHTPHRNHLHPHIHDPNLHHTNRNRLPNPKPLLEHLALLPILIPPDIRLPSTHTYSSRQARRQ